MYSNKKIPLPIIILVVLVIISVGLGGFSFWQYHTKGETSLRSFQLFKDKRAQDYMNQAENLLDKVKTTEKTNKKEYQTKISKAAEFVNKATELKPDNAKLWARRGDFYKELLNLGIKGSKQEAVESYEKALELKPDNDLYQRKLEETKETEDNI